MSATLKTYNPAGQKIGEMKTDSVLFTEAVKPGVVHEVYTLAAASMRQGGSHTKTRGEVRGGGAKPWKQKGTGRARHGSTRSPIWVGGGITFGPRKDKNYVRKINREANRVVLRMVFSNRAAHERVFVLPDWSTESKTKSFAALLTQLGVLGRSVLVITDGAQTPVIRAARNIQQVQVLPAQEVNVVELLEHQYIVLDNAALAALEQLFVK